MKHLRKILLLLICAMFCLQTGEAAQEQQELGYWLERLPEKEQILLTPKEIANFNEKIQAQPESGVFDLKLYPKNISGSNLKKWLKAAEMPDGFVNGKPIEAAWSNAVLQRLNLAAVKEMNSVAYGLLTERCNLRSLPTATPVFESADDRDFDQLQSTILNPGEGVVILQRSGDGLWFFVQASIYRGWVSSGSVAVAERQAWLDYLSSERFITVTGIKLVLDAEGRRIVAEMGTKLPLAENDKTLLLPQRDAAGDLKLLQVKLPEGSDAVRGYLPYNRENVLRQAFKFKGQPYGWGGLQESVDCSSLIMDVYRSFGFTLPRDADTQELAAAGKTTTLQQAERAAQLDAAAPGAAFYMPGHTMLYLGKSENRYYVIHSLGSYGVPDKNGKFQRVAAMQVIVSELGLTRKNGKTFFESLTSVREF